MWLRLLLRGHQAGLIPAALYEYRRWAGSLTARKVDLAIGCLSVLDRAEELVSREDQAEVLAQTKRAWRLRAVRHARDTCDFAENGRWHLRHWGPPAIPRANARGCLRTAWFPDLQRSGRRCNTVCCGSESGPLSVRIHPANERADDRVESIRLLEIAEVAGALDRLVMCAGNDAREAGRQRRRGDPILVAANHQCRHPDRIGAVGLVGQPNRLGADPGMRPGSIRPIVSMTSARTAGSAGWASSTSTRDSANIRMFSLAARERS